MKIIDRYVGRAVTSAIIVVVAILVLVFALFAFIDELGDVGRGNYGLPQALWFVILSMPRLGYELLPMAALIGALLALSTLVRQGELTAVRAAGVPLWRVIAGVMKAGLIVMFIAVVIGEFIAPPTDQAARNARSIALAAQLALKTKNGMWTRDERSYVNIRSVLPGNRVEDIFIYEFDEANRLKASTHAKRAYHEDRLWILEGIEQTVFLDGEIKRQSIERARWESLLKPELVEILVVKPNTLAMVDLVRYIRYLTDNGQDAVRYQQALWSKISYPLAAAVMVFLAVPMVLSAGRTTNIGQRILLGAFIGLAFHVINQGAGHLGVVLNLNPALAVIAPTLLTFLIAAGLMLRVR